MKNHTALSLLLLLLLITTSLYSQTSRKVLGIIYKANSSGVKPPVPSGASVFIPGIGSSTTDDNGYYSIDISKCSVCKAGEKLTIHVNSSIGYAEAEYIIPTNPLLNSFDVGVSVNNKISINGIVKDRESGRAIEGIKVIILIQNYDKTIPSVITDENGIFQIILRKEGISDMQAIQIFFNDNGENRYKELDKTVFINKYEPIKVELEKCSDCGTKTSFAINTYSKTSVQVEPGDLVIIRASGTIKVGNFVGSSGPEGIPNNRGVLGMTLEAYNFDECKICNHAVLLYRFGEHDSWKYYQSATKNEYIVQKSGYLEFAINDTQQSDNSGYYQVQVTIRK